MFLFLLSENIGFFVSLFWVYFYNFEALSYLEKNVITFCPNSCYISNQVITFDMLSFKQLLLSNDIVYFAYICDI